jgi:hypothetical protein
MRRQLRDKRNALRRDHDERTIKKQWKSLGARKDRQQLTAAGFDGGRCLHCEQPFSMDGKSKQTQFVFLFSLLFVLFVWCVCHLLGL